MGTDYPHLHPDMTLGEGGMLQHSLARKFGCLVVLPHQNFLHTYIKHGDPMPNCQIKILFFNGHLDLNCLICFPPVFPTVQHWTRCKKLIIYSSNWHVDVSFLVTLILTALLVIQQSLMNVWKVNNSSCTYMCECVWYVHFWHSLMCKEVSMSHMYQSTRYAYMYKWITIVQKPQCVEQLVA